MKTLKTILFVITISLFFTFCKGEKVEKVSERNFTNTELYGTWNQTNTDNNSNIESIELLKDSIAKIKLTDANGEKFVTGKWLTEFDKKVESLNLTINSDIKITFYSDEQNLVVNFLQVSEENEKLMMSGPSLKFEKE